MTSIERISVLADGVRSRALLAVCSGELTVRYEGEKPVTLKPGMYAYGPAGKVHEASCAKGDPCVLFIAFESPLDAVQAKGPVK